MGQYAGAIAEEFFSSLLYKSGLQYTFDDDWYDYLVEGQKVELKSCQLTIVNPYKKRGNDYEGNRIGRFDFTNKDNREVQIKENVWIALVIRHKKQCILFGFIMANQLNGSRYLSLHKARELKPITLKQWISTLGVRRHVERGCPFCGKKLKEEVEDDNKI